MEYILEEKKYSKKSRAKPIKYIINNDCWECISHPKIGNYLSICRNNKKQYLHRYVYELNNNKEIPENMVIMHLCDNTLCINPNHLKLGTQQDNMNDMKEKNRSLKGNKLTEEHKEKISIKTKEKTHRGFKHSNSISKDLFNIIKQKLYENTEEKWTKKYERLSLELNVSISTIRRIKEKRLHTILGENNDS